MRASTALRLARAYGRSWLIRPPGPLRAVIQITRRCNERCGMCRSWAFPTAGEITAPEITRLLRAMPDLVWLDVTGGEPFSRPDIADVWRRVLDDTPSLQVLHFPTNGWFTDRVAAAARGRRAAAPPPGAGGGRAAGALRP